MRILFISIFLLHSIFGADSANAKKYRSEKINYIYEKALQHIDNRQNLARLETELSGYDGIYMDTKEKHGIGKVDNLNKELIKIDKKLIKILEKYGLEKAAVAFREKTKLKNGWEYQEENLVLPSEKFVDDRLQKLWYQAQNGKFSDNELLELHKELKAVELKMRIYDDHLEDLTKVPHENSIHFDTDSDSLSEKTKKLKLANRLLNEHLDEVHKKVNDEEYSPFEEPKVKKLWKAARENSKFSLHDLELLKEELTQFENQLKKIEFHKKEIESMKEIRESAGKSELNNIEGAELDARHEKLNRKARKLEKYLEQKVMHTELKKMFDSVLSTLSRKRVASEAVSAQQLTDKTNLQIYVETRVDVLPQEKKAKMAASQKVCLKCLAGESGHITHVLSNISA